MPYVPPADHWSPGVYLASHRGHYLDRDVVRFATSLGFQIDPFAQFACRAYEDQNHEADYPHEALRDLADDAIEFLNDRYNPDPDHLTWGYDDGDFGLWDMDENAW